MDSRDLGFRLAVIMRSSWRLLLSVSAILFVATGVIYWIAKPHHDSAVAGRWADICSTVFNESHSCEHGWFETSFYPNGIVKRTYFGESPDMLVIEEGDWSTSGGKLRLHLTKSTVKDHTSEINEVDTFDYKTYFKPVKSGGLQAFDHLTMIVQEMKEYDQTGFAKVTSLASGRVQAEELIKTDVYEK